MNDAPKPKQQPNLTPPFDRIIFPSTIFIPIPPYVLVNIVLILEQFRSQVYAIIAGCLSVAFHRNICAGVSGSDNIGGEI
jgi:hypothetical protein